MFCKTPLEYFYDISNLIGTLLEFPDAVSDFVWVLIFLGFLVLGWYFIFRDGPCTLGGRPLHTAIMLRANKGRED